MKFLSSIHYMIWLALSLVFFAAGEFWSKKFALDPKFSYVVLVTVIYALGSLAWLPAILQKNQLSIVGTMWSVLSLAITVAIGIMFFGEKLTFVGTAGIILAVVSVILLSIG